METHIYRWNPDREPRPRLELFQLPLEQGMTVLDLLSTALEQDGSLAFRQSCREGICGACAMLVNGYYRLACKTPVADLKRRPLVLAPLPRLRVIKDLVVDLAPVWRAHGKVMPYLVPAGDPADKREHLQTPEQRHRIEPLLACSLCGSCYAACPSHWSGRHHLGPAALARVYRFATDSRDGAGAERLRRVATEDGLWRCHSAFTCVEACPRGVDCAAAIHALKREAIRPSR